MAELDPAWEYYTPDPEVEAAVYGRRARGLDLLHDPETWRGANRGFRFGRGNPNRGACFRLARERRPATRREAPEAKWCPACGRQFVPARKGRVCCSRSCARRGPRSDESAACPECGATFSPRSPGQSYCSRRCAGAVGARACRADPPAEFADAYLAGTPMGVLADKFGVGKCQLKRWRRKLGLQARPTGRRARAGEGNKGA